MAENIYNAALAHSTRRILNKLVFDNGDKGKVPVGGESLISINLTESYNSSDGITMGATCANAMTVDMLVPDKLVFQNATIEAYSEVNGTQIPLGRFYVCSHNTENNYKTVTLECYDAFCKTEEKYVPSLLEGASVEEVALDIAKKCGFDIDFDFEPYRDIKIPWYGDFTCRQMLGYIAGLMGKNAHFNREGKLTFSWYENEGKVIKRESQYRGQFKKLRNETQAINSLISGSEEEQVTGGEGFGIAFENPYMDKARLDAILDQVRGFTFQPCQVAYRGDLTIRPGTVVAIEDNVGDMFYACVMEQNIILNGGMSSTLYSYGKEDMDYSFEVSSASQSLKKLSGRMDRAVTMSKEIKDSKGGVLQVIDRDGDGINDSMVIRMASAGGDDSITGQRAKYILLNANGIGLSNDGGHFFKTAISSEGICTEALNVKEIFAQEIGVSGVELADMLKVHEHEQEGMVLTIGSGTNNVIMQQENDRIVFYEKGESPEKALCSFGVQTGTGKKVLTLGNLSVEAWTDGRVVFSTGGKV